MTSVVVADDQDLVRSGLEMVLAARGIEVVGTAADGREAVEVVRRTRPDVILMDIRMPVLDGIAATAQISHADLSTRVLVLTTYDLASRSPSANSSPPAPRSRRRRPRDCRASR